MPKKLAILICSLLACSSTYANWFQDIINTINQQSGMTNGWLSNINTQQSAVLESQNIERLMKQVDGDLSSHSGWGTYQSHDYQSYGEAAKNWSGVMAMAGRGNSGGELGQVMTRVAKQFPHDQTVFNKGVSHKPSQQYYELASQTVLATRSASELDYDKIQDQIAYQHMLQQQIEKTNDLKAAVDLNNRLQVENNLINLAILRHAALSNQQQALVEQATVNTALSNAKFLTKTEG